MVARDLERHLNDVSLGSAAFAIALWIDEGYGSADERAIFGVSIGTVAEVDGMRAAPALREIPDDQWYSRPCSERWNSGNWAHIVEQFLTPETEQALDPLREAIRIDEDLLEHHRPSCDFGWPCSCESTAVRRWIEVGVAALAGTKVPATLPTTPDLLVFAESPDLSCAQRITAMRRTIDAARFHETFPAWQAACQDCRR